MSMLLVNPKGKIRSVKDAKGSDYEIDIRLGAWLRSRRMEMRLTIDQVAARTMLTQERLRDLEAGNAYRGITRIEAHKLAEAYCLEPADIMVRAVA